MPHDFLWTENLSPLVLNIHEKKLYVIGEPPTGREFRLYNKPQPPYIGFVFENGQFKRIPFESIPKEIYDINMLIEAIPPSKIDYLNLAKKENITNAILDGNPPAIRELNKRIDPKFKSNFWKLLTLINLRD